jgi:hypothetical protein
LVVSTCECAFGVDLNLLTSLASITHPLSQTKAQTPNTSSPRRRFLPPVALLISTALFFTIVHVAHERAAPAPAAAVNRSNQRREKTRIAFVGNSMFYFNDFPRFFTEFSRRSGGNNTTNRIVQQNSCLHGGGSFPSLMLEGSAMYPQFRTPQAFIETDSNGNDIYDYGACTVRQLLTGVDDRLHDPGYAVVTLPDIHSAPTSIIGAPPINSSNPCRADPAYLTYCQQTAAYSSLDDDETTTWDFLLLNDNTRNPARLATRQHSLQFLELHYIPLLLELPQPRPVPVFMWTHAYSTINNNSSNNSNTTESTGEEGMTGLEDVANFTSLTAVGYRAYAKMLQQYGFTDVRIAPVGLAFLAVWEENFALWQTLFHNADHLHASPSGTFLQGLVVYHTLFGELPAKDHVVRADMGVYWKTARMMQHAWEPPNPMPTPETADYLYGIAEGVLVHGHVPVSFIDYQNGEAAYEGN